MQTGTTPPQPHRLNYLIVFLAVLVVLAVGGGVAAIVASGNHEPAPAITTAAAGTRQLAGATAATSSAAENDTIALLVPSGWTGSKGAEDFLLVPPDKVGLNGYFSAPFKGSLLDLFRGIAGYRARGLQSPRFCIKPTSVRMPNGPTGVQFGICGTYVPQNGQAFQTVRYEALGLARGAYAEVNFYTAPTSAALEHFIGEARPVTTSVHWKLLG